RRAMRAACGVTVRRFLRTLRSGNHGNRRSALIELQLDASVAREGVLALRWIERAKLGITRGNQTVGRDALAFQEFDHADRARGRQFPGRGELRAVDRPGVRVAVDPEDPIDVRRNLVGDLN